MAAVSGLASTIAWTGYTGLYAAAGYVAPYAFTLDVAGGTFPTTAMDTTPGTVIVASNGARPYSWGGTITCRAPKPAQSGYSANVSWGAGNYSTNVREFSLDISWGEKQVTAFDGTGVVAHSYIPLLASWRGAFSGYVDGTTALALPTVPGGTIQTLTMLLFNTTLDDTLIGTAIVEALGASVGVETGGDFNYAFTGTGQLTAAGTEYGVNSSGIFDDAAGTLITPTAGSLVLTAAASRTYTGNAFPTGFSLRCGVDTGVEATIKFRGTGALTIA